MDDLAIVADDTGLALLAELPYKRNPDRPDGPFTAIGRRLATVRSKWLQR